jgi:23S rRNA pseudouridine1911/1915/1917 synthase
VPEAEEPGRPLRQIRPETGICFFRVTEASGLVDFLQRADFSPLPQPSIERVQKWLAFGAVYVDGQRRRVDLPLTPDQILRVHTHPKRYAVPFPEIQGRLVFEEEDFLVLDKPAGLPTHPTLDNYRENAKVRLEEELGRPLYTTHRLDIPTQGLLIFAKTPEAQVLLNRAFSKGRVSKTYRSLNEAALPLGPHTHYMNPKSRVPKQVTLEPRAGWWECRLRVDAVGVMPQGHAHEITLMTGKTHQIRAQAAALGAPILGDMTYGAKENSVHERIELECFRLSFALRSRTFLIARRESIAPCFNY